MNRTLSWVGALTMSAVAVLLAACAETPTAPKTPSLNGRILDSAGRPVSQGRVVLVYRIESGSSPLDTCDTFDPRRAVSVYPNPTSSSSVISMRLPNDCRVRVEVRDRTGAMVRTMVDRTQPAGNHTLQWDGTSDSAMPVRNGIYVLRWTITEGDSVFTGCRRLLLDRVNVTNAVGRYDAVSDGDGRFSIPLDILPIGDGGLGTDALGNPVSNFVIAPLVDVCVAESPEPSAATACVVQVPLGDLSKSVSVTVRLP